jgi:4-hydroxy-tetrahydrodipicolinate reductase
MQRLIHVDTTLSLLHVGLGPLGLRIETDLLARRIGRVVAAVDLSPELAGKPLASIVPGASADVRVLRSLAQIDDWEQFDAAIVTTSSDLRACADTFRTLLAHGVPVVSTCEELVFPWLRHKELAKELDALAKAYGTQLLGTGVNPGFVMDALPVFASGVCNAVRSVRMFRIQDASSRRIPFQQKIGAGLDVATFSARVEDGSLRHVGLGESLHFVAQRLSFDVERWSETIEPVLAQQPLQCALGPIPVGHAAGVRQTATGICGGKPLIQLEFQAAIGQADPHDRVVLDGDPRIDLVIQGGVHGDTATSAIVINTLQPLITADPGLHTMATIAPASCRDAGIRR